MINETLKATGKVQFELNGEVVHSTNLVVDVGLAWIAERVAAATANPMSHMAVGSGTTPPAAGNTALENELGRAPLDSTAHNGNQMTLVTTFQAGVGTGALTEAGVFDASTAGTMLARTTFPVINKGADDILIVTWVITFA